MTRGQIARLQDLSKCYGLQRSDVNFVKAWHLFTTETDQMEKREKKILRRLTHQYRHQIAAIRKNQK